MTRRGLEAIVCTISYGAVVDLVRRLLPAAGRLAGTDKATILDLLDVDDGRPTREIAAAIRLSTRSTRTRLARLVERGLVREVGTGPNDPRRRYMLALE